jgi:hypothetical protein
MNVMMKNTTVFSGADSNECRSWVRHVETILQLPKRFLHLWMKNCTSSRKTKSTIKSRGHAWSNFTGEVWIFLFMKLWTKRQRAVFYRKKCRQYVMEKQFGPRIFEEEPQISSV